MFLSYISAEYNWTAVRVRFCFTFKTIGVGCKPRLQLFSRLLQNQFCNCCEEFQHSDSLIYLLFSPCSGPEFLPSDSRYFHWVLPFRAQAMPDTIDIEPWARTRWVFLSSVQQKSHRADFSKTFAGLLSPNYVAPSILYIITMCVVCFSRLPLFAGLFFLIGECRQLWANLAVPAEWTFVSNYYSHI